MKIKCPGCSSVLSIPDAAAGKVVKCRCGKQLRAPGVAPSAANASAKASVSSQSPKVRQPSAQRPVAQPSSQQPSSQQPSSQRPMATRAAAQPSGASGFGGFDAGMFDELTESDLKPVAPVLTPGLAGAPRSPGGNLMQQYGGGGDVSNSAANGSGSRPGTLTFLGVVNGFWACIYLFLMLALFGLLAIIPALGEEVPAEGGTILAVLAAVMGLMVALSIATCVSCFVAKPICWYIVLFSYGYGFGDRIAMLIGWIQEGVPVSKIVGGCVGLLVGGLFWAYLHQTEARAFYKTVETKFPTVLAADILGVSVGVGLGVVAFLL